jgi:hypothetical protein
MTRAESAQPGPRPPTRQHGWYGGFFSATSSGRNQPTDGVPHGSSPGGPRLRSAYEVARSTK